MKQILTLFFFLHLPSLAWSVDCDDTNKVYKVCSDQSAAFMKVAKKAKSDKKLVLVKFGADWCPWCISLNRLFNEKKFWSSLDQKLVLKEVGLYKYNSRDKIESGESILEKLLSKNGKTRKEVKGVPFLAVVRPSDNKAVFIETGSLEDNSSGKGHDPDKVKAALDQAIVSLK
jgi:thiol-disulfide isomerase/thioredoxin